MDGQDSERGRISVLHVLGMIENERGGSASATLGIAAATVAGGDRTTVLTTVGSGSPATVPSGVEMVACDRQWPRHISFSWPLTRWLWHNLRRFDLVEVHEVFAFPTLVTWWLAKALRVPFVVHPHGSLEPYDMHHKHERVKNLLRPGLRRMLRDAAAVWLTARREADNLAHLGGGFRRVVTPLPVPPADRTGSRERFRDRHELAPDAPVVLFLGRLDPKKGLHRLLDAFETVRDRLGAAHLVIAGSGEPGFVDELRRRAVASRHADAIHLVGFLSGQDKSDALIGSDLFVLHSDNENFGIAPVEALRCGTPLLLSDEVYIADELRSAGAAQVVPLSAPGELGPAIIALLDDPGERRRLSSNSAEAASVYSLDAVAERDALARRDLLRAVARPSRHAARRPVGRTE